MKSFWPYFLEREDLSRLKPDSDAWRRQHDECSRQIQNALIFLGGFCLFCLSALGQTDVILLEGGAVSLPFTGVYVSSSAFLVVGPILLSAFTVHLHVLVSYWQALKTSPGHLALPFIFNIKVPGSLLLSWFLLYWMVPAVLTIFAWRVLPLQSAFYRGIPIIVTFLITTRMLSLQIFRCDQKHYQNRVRWLLGILLVIFMLAMSYQRPFNLAGANLQGKNLRGFNLERATLFQANLIKANLERAHLKKVNLRGADLREANLGGADLSEADLSEADLRGVDLTKADLTGAKLREANLQGATLSGDTRLVEAILREADLSGANLEKAFLLKSNLSKAVLSNAKLRKTRILWSDLAEADLKQANLPDATLRDTDLSNASLDGADLGKVDLQDSKLNKASLKGANLSGARLTQEQIKSAITDKNTKLPSSLVLTGSMCEE